MPLVNCTISPIPVLRHTGMLYIINSKPLANELSYNPTTFAEWVGAITKDATGIELTANGAEYCFATLPLLVPLKSFMKYGLLFNVVSSTLSFPLFAPAGITTFGNYAPLTKNVGNYKTTVLSNVVNVPAFSFVVQNVESAGNKIKIKDVRVFELFPGSQLEQDFMYLSADELNAKYSIVTGSDGRTL